MYFILIAVLSIGCASKTGVLKQEPVPEVIVKKINPYDKNLWVNDSARSADFKEAFSKISKITLRYNGSIEEQGVWKNSMEKNLLRMGILVNEESKKDSFLESDDDAKELKSDAVLLIDKINLIKVDSGKTSKDFIVNNDSDYKYTFFVAEITGKIILKNGDVIWNSTVSVSSFDLLKSSEGIEPEITFKKASRFRFSEKLDEWIKDGWNFFAEDNFQTKYKTNYDESRHKADLINMAVSGFIGNIKSENVVNSR